MNVNELYRQLDKVRQTASELSTLALHSLEISLRVDHQGSICKSLRPVAERGQTTIRYDNLWSDVSEDMFNQALGEIDALRRSMTARLQHASICIQRDLLEHNFGGTVSFWRNGDSWLPPQVHYDSRDYGSELRFVDGFDAGNGDIKAFICKTDLWQMPEEYQSCFITDFWPDFSVKASDSVEYSSGPPPSIDMDTLITELEKRGIMEGLWT